MATTVKTRPNHYELLGLAPNATSDELFAAFRKAMGLFSAHPTSSAAQLSVAFETLRNPAKRRAYDEARGLNRPPEPPAAPPPQLVGAAFIASASHEAAVQALRDKLARLAAPAPPNPAEPAPQASTPPEPRVAAFIASSVRGAGEPWPVPTRDEAPIRPKLTRAAPQSEPASPVMRAQPTIADAADESPLEWRRPAMIAGGLVAAAGLIGAMAGVSVRDDSSGKAAKADVTIPLPAPRPAAAAAPAASVVDSWTTARPLTAARPIRAHPSRSRAIAVQPDTIADSRASAPPPLESAIAEAPETVPVETASATLPLSKAVMARTIERIGYACGSVASAAAVDGSAGVFKVTCSSGHSYQASPVKGRYHFRRLGKP